MRTDPHSALRRIPQEPADAGLSGHFYAREGRETTVDAIERARREALVLQKIADLLTPEDRELWLEMRERTGRWSAYQAAVIGAIEWNAGAGDTPEESLAGVRGKIEEYNQACERLNETLDASVAIPSH